jgi:WD40 repeat protein
LASTSFDSILIVWKASSGAAQLALEPYYSATVAWSPQGNQIACASSDGRGNPCISIIDAGTGRVVHVLERVHDSSVSAIAWSESNFCIGSSSTNAIKIWSPNPNAQPLKLSIGAQSHYVNSIAWSPKGNRLAAAYYDCMVKIWDYPSGRLLHAVKAHSDEVVSVSWSPSGDRLASASHDGSICIHDCHGTPRIVGYLFALDDKGFAATAEGYVAGDSEALGAVRFSDGQATYELSDLPEFHSLKHVEKAFRSRAA